MLSNMHRGHSFGPIELIARFNVLLMAVKYIVA